MVHYEPPAMSRQYEHGRSSIMLGVRIAKGTVTAPPITWFSLDLAERSLRRPRLRVSLIRSYTVQLARAAGPARNLQTAAAPGTAMEPANCGPCRVLGAAVVRHHGTPTLKGTAGGSNVATADIQQ